MKTTLTDVPVHVLEKYVHPANLLTLSHTSRHLKSSVPKKDLPAKQALHEAFVAMSLAHPRLFFTDLYHVNRRRRTGPHRLFLIQIYLLATDLCEVLGPPTGAWRVTKACLQDNLKAWAAGVKRVFLATPLPVLKESLGFLRQAP